MLKKMGKFFKGMQSTGTWVDEATEMTAKQFTHAQDALMYSAITQGTSVSVAEGLEDWDGGEDLVICPDANRGSPDCQYCPCAEVHSRSECHQWVNTWGEHKESSGCPECDKVDQEQYDEIHTEEPLFFQWPDDAVRYGDVTPQVNAYAVRDLLLQGRFSKIWKKFVGSPNFLPKNNGTIKFRRYYQPDMEKTGDDLLSRQLEKTNEAEEAKKISGKGPHS